MSKEVIIVCGPTATGKTKKALELAKELEGELISADSRQVYKYIPIASNVGDLNHKSQVSNIKQQSKSKDQNLKLNGIPAHLIQYLEPWQQTNVYEWREKAYETIEDIFSRGNQPIIVGGTGLYIDSLVNSYELSAGGNELNLELRDELNKLELKELQIRVKSQSIELWMQLNTSDQNNPRRLIRILEKAQSSKPQALGNNKNSKLKTYNYKLYYPTYDWEELKLRIEKRVDEMFAEGLVKEVKDLIAYCNSVSSSSQESETEVNSKLTTQYPILKVMGVSQVIEFLEGKISMKECRERIIIAHRQYARRQRTWFERGAKNYEFEYFAI